MEHGSAASWLSSWWLHRALLSTRRYARGILLDVGCGRAPYRGVFPVERHVTCDRPSTLHGHAGIDVFADARALPFADAAFDTVLCTEVLEHIPAPELVIGEIARVLRSGGHVILSVPFLYSIHEQPYDFVRFTEHGLTEILRAHELEPVELIRRGGAAAVISDLGAKIAYRVMRSTLDRAHAPRGIQEALIQAATVPPQWMVARAAELSEKWLPRAARLVGASNVTTLGYVVVARRH